jgi:hypothetical protein
MELIVLMIMTYGIYIVCGFVFIGAMSSDTEDEW